MASTITGNVGGASFSAAQVQAVNILTKAITFATVDGSGNYSFASLPAGTYQITATIGSNIYYHPVQVIADGTTTYSNINLNPTALSAANAAVQATNY
jgi:hypothetical protein